MSLFTSAMISGLGIVGTFGLYGVITLYGAMKFTKDLKST
jgi:hypothetical protein